MTDTLDQLYSEDKTPHHRRMFTLSVLTEDKAGLLNNITIIFTRRKININSLNVSNSEVSDVSRFTIVATATKDEIIKVVKQIRKLVDVLGAFVYEEDQIYYQEIALYKVPTDEFLNGNSIENMVRNNGARILVIEKDYIIIEKTGHKEETHQLYKMLEPYGLLEFVRSGRVAISKSKRKQRRTSMNWRRLNPINLVSKTLNLNQSNKMARINFGGVEEEVVTRDEFPLDKAKRGYERRNHRHHWLWSFRVLDNHSTCVTMDSM